MDDMITEIRTLGWFRINLDETPELGIEDDAEPNVVIFGLGMTKKTHFAMQAGDEDENSDILLDIVEELTGNWLFDAKKCEEAI